MADIGFVTSNQFNCELVEFREVVARICDFPRFEAKPTDDLKNALKIPGFFLFGVRIVIPQVAFAAVVGCVSKINENSFGMADMKIAIGLRGETCPDLATC
jgi:hypothetical protein